VSQIAQLRRRLILREYGAAVGKTGGFKGTAFPAAINNAVFFMAMVKVFFNSGDVNEYVRQKFRQGIQIWIQARQP
jgi:hypothetical protein